MLLLYFIFTAGFPYSLIEMRFNFLTRMVVHYTMYNHHQTRLDWNCLQLDWKIFLPRARLEKLHCCVWWGECWVVQGRRGVKPGMMLRDLKCQAAQLSAQTRPSHSGDCQQWGLHHKWQGRSQSVTELRLDLIWCDVEKLMGSPASQNFILILPTEWESWGFSRN